MAAKSPAAYLWVVVDVVEVDPRPGFLVHGHSSAFDAHAVVENPFHWARALSVKPHAVVFDGPPASIDLGRTTVLPAVLWCAAGHEVRERTSGWIRGQRTGARRRGPGHGSAKANGVAGIHDMGATIGAEMEP